MERDQCLNITCRGCRHYEFRYRAASRSRRQGQAAYWHVASVMFWPIREKPSWQSRNGRFKLCVGGTGHCGIDQAICRVDDFEWCLLAGNPLAIAEQVVIVLLIGQSGNPALRLQRRDAAHLATALSVHSAVRLDFAARIWAWGTPRSSRIGRRSDR